MNKFSSLINLIFIGRRSPTTNVQQTDPQTLYADAENLELLGQRLDAIRMAYWKAFYSGQSDWMVLYAQIEAQLTRRWKSAVEFYSNPRNSHIVR